MAHYIETGARPVIILLSCFLTAMPLDRSLLRHWGEEKKEVLVREGCKGQPLFLASASPCQARRIQIPWCTSIWTITSLGPRTARFVARKEKAVICHDVWFLLPVLQGLIIQFPVSCFLSRLSCLFLCGFSTMTYVSSLLWIKPLIRLVQESDCLLRLETFFFALNFFSGIWVVN